MPPHEDVPRNPDLVAFGMLVRTHGILSGMSQERFGRRVGLDQGSMSRLERGILPGIRLRKVVGILSEMGLFKRRAAQTTRIHGPT